MNTMQNKRGFLKVNLVVLKFMISLGNTTEYSYTTKTLRNENIFNLNLVLFQ